mmetsp:Transcript_17948/g.50610  ORF Transcript_17948/g.50610 Transcript_17948/m.50610 type:complete len:320 (+) Transcript_17948:212-1171(+)
MEKNGKLMPDIAFGTYQIPPEKTEEAVLEAIRIGYRHVDCSPAYGNEPEVGKALRAALEEGLVKEEEMFVTTKLYNTFHRPEHVRQTAVESKKNLGYVDLYLLHWPIATSYEAYQRTGDFHPLDDQGKIICDYNIPIHVTWKAMEELVDTGIVRALGVSNFTVIALHDLLSYARHRPLANQVELHPFLPQHRLVSYCLRRNVKPIAYSPLSSPGFDPSSITPPSARLPPKPSLFDNSALLPIAAAHAPRTVAQVVLKWNLTRGCAIAPKSLNPNRMRENFQIGDLELSESEMAIIDSLHMSSPFRVFDAAYFCDIPCFD